MLQYIDILIEITIILHLYLQELDHIGNEITIDTIKRTDPNIYECIAKNSVPPATSRIFNIEIHCIYDLINN